MFYVTLLYKVSDVLAVFSVKECIWGCWGPPVFKLGHFLHLITSNPLSSPALVHGKEDTTEQWQDEHQVANLAKVIA